MKHQSTGDIFNYILFDALGRNQTCYIFAEELNQNYAHWTANAVADIHGIEEYMYNSRDVWISQVHPDDQNYIHRGLDFVLTEKQEFTCECRIRRRNDEYIWTKTVLNYYENEDNDLKWLVGLIYNNGAILPVDSVTQLHNIYELHRELGLHLINNDEYGAVLYFGIDNFKRINDRYTYAGGNEVLRAFARELSKVLPSLSTLYRLDGDKFAILYKDAGKLDLAILFDKIRQAANRVTVAGFKIVDMELSAGAAFYPKDGDTPDELLRNAEYSLQKAKIGRRGSLLFFHRDLLEESLYGMRLLESLKESIADNYNGFELYFQPIVNTKTNEIDQCETLLRWNHPEYPGISPLEFIPILESSGLIQRVGRWIIDTAIRKAKFWMDQYGPMLLNINISYAQMEQEDFCDYVISCTEKYEYPPSLLVLELTESCRYKDMKMLANMMKKLRWHKIKVALDDFGTGYASLSVLRDVTVDWIKIDHNFMKQCKNDHVDRNIVKHMILLAHAIGVKVCVEGVENEDIHAIAKEEEADTLQGYYFGKPLKEQDFEKVILKQVS